DELPHGADTLEAVHDIDRITQDSDSPVPSADELDVLAPHPKLDIGQLDTILDSLHQPIALAADRGKHFTLIVIGLEPIQALRIDHAAHNQIVALDSDSGIHDLDFGSHGSRRLLQHGVFLLWCG